MGRRTLTLSAPRFFLKITHTDTKFSEMQEGWKESRQQSRFAFYVGYYEHAHGSYRIVMSDSY